MVATIEVSVPRVDQKMVEKQTINFLLFVSAESHFLYTYCSVGELLLTTGRLWYSNAVSAGGCAV